MLANLSGDVFLNRISCFADATLDWTGLLVTASGGFFGQTPVTIPFQLPVYDNRDPTVGDLDGISPVF